MNSFSISNFPIFTPIISQKYESIQSQEILMSSKIKIQNTSGSNLNLLLKDNEISLCVSQAKGLRVIGSIQIDNRLKFQRILQFENVVKMRLKGIKLMNNMNNTIIFQFQQYLQINLWIKKLSYKILQINFHHIFKPIKILGKGTFGTVYQILRLYDGNRYAAKIFNKEYLLKNQLIRRNFYNQLEIIKEIQHYNLIHLDGIFQTQTSYYFIMEILNGGNLYQYLISKKEQKYIHIKLIQNIMKGILNGLQYLSNFNIIHRDIKLENIMFRSKNNYSIVIIDFGLAINQYDYENIYTPCGTPGYISPQIINFKNQSKITCKSDIFSAGVILHILLTGKFLFQGQNAKQIYQNNKLMKFDLNKDIYKMCYPPLVDLMKQMLSINPQNRPSAQQCLEHEGLISIEEQKILISNMTISHEASS